MRMYVTSRLWVAYLWRKNYSLQLSEPAVQWNQEFLPTLFATMRVSDFMYICTPSTGVQVWRWCHLILSYKYRSSSSMTNLFSVFSRSDTTVDLIGSATNLNCCASLTGGTNATPIAVLCDWFNSHVPSGLKWRVTTLWRITDVMTIHVVWHMTPCMFVHETARLSLKLVTGAQLGCGGVTDGRVRRRKYWWRSEYFRWKFFHFLPSKILNYSAK